MVSATELILIEREGDGDGDKEIVGIRENEICRKDRQQAPKSASPSVLWLWLYRNPPTHGRKRLCPSDSDYGYQRNIQSIIQSVWLQLQFHVETRVEMSLVTRRIPFLFVFAFP